jgi:DHA1 family tetracycline resistance protein-like MFS transporter
MTPRILSHYSPTTPPAATDGLNQRHRLLLDPLQASSTISSNEDDEQQRQKDRRRKLAVGAILASSFLNLLGFTMAGPITPALGKHFGLEVGASFGSLTSAYPLGMLFGLIFWPTLSDKIGRKRIMTLSLFGSALGLAIQSVVIRRDLTLPVFLAARVFTGAFAGSSPVSKAYLADVGYRDGKLPRYLSLRDAASTMAFIVGPMLGGIIYDLRKWFLGVSSTATNLVDTTGSLAFVIGVSSAASLAASLLVGSLVTDVKSKKKRVAGQVNESLGSDEENDEEEIVACPLGQQMWAGVASVCVVSFLFNVGDSTFHAFFSALLRDGARMSAGDIGLLYTLLACISFSVSTTSSGWIMKKWGPVWACAAGLACVGTGLSALGVAAWGGIAAVPASFSVLAAAAAIYYCGVPLYGPTIPTMLLRCVPSSRRGAIMGLDGTINTIARIVSPLFMGDIYRRYGAGAAFGLAGTMVFGGMFTALFRRYIVLRDSFPARTKA